jgi:hypothetical protein
MTQLPNHQILPISRLASIFSSVTNSYKFYWFLAILKFIETDRKPIIQLNDIALRMLSDVWYPLDYYKLSFGKQDGFKPLVETINEKIEVDNSSTAPALFDQIASKLSSHEQQELSDKVSRLLRWVPYRFQRPFVAEDVRGTKDHQVNQTIVRLAEQHFEKQKGQIMYRYLDGAIQIQPMWYDYLQENIAILRGFVDWELSNFLQKNNPNSIGITEKLFKPKVRNLRSATSFWKLYLDMHGPANCIYSDQIIEPGTLSIDHFIPWRYVVHDELWNLTPTIGTVNSSKSDNLPSLASYLSKFSSLHYDVFHKILSADIKQKDKLLEDYSMVFRDHLSNIRSYSKENFKNKLGEIIKPLHQTATNLGFNPNWTYSDKL